jgi:hypothetical protein
MLADYIAKDLADDYVVMERSAVTASGLMAI